MAIAFAVTGMSRAPSLVTDIQSGYFECLLAANATPVIIPPLTRESDISPILDRLDGVMLAGLMFQVAIALGIVMLPPYTTDARQAIELIRGGRLRASFWYGVILAGGAIPAIFLTYALTAEAPLMALSRLAAILALLGVFIFDEIWIMAGQAAPLS